MLIVKNKNKYLHFLSKVLMGLLLINCWTTLALPGQASIPQDQKPITMDNEKRSVELAVQQFYEALNILFAGNAEPMKEVWSHADDATYLGPAGDIRIGWPAIEADWENQAALKLGGKITPSNFHYILGPQISIVVNEENGENIGPDGKPIPVSIRATHIFRKEKGKWKMIGDHVDLIPFLSK